MSHKGGSQLLQEGVALFHIAMGETLEQCTNLKERVNTHIRTEYDTQS